MGALGTAALLSLGTAPASAEEQPKEQPWYSVSEIRGGVLAHDARPVSSGKESSADFNLEAYLQPLGDPDSLFLFRPRPSFGGNINLSGNTDYGFLGLNWGLGFDSFFLSADLGMAFHDGYLHHPPRDRKALGSVALFRESIELGYRFTEHWGVSLYLDHLSDAGLLDHTNEGLESWGLRVSYRF